MKIIYVKYKILVNGLATTNKFSIDGFTLKSSNFDKKLFNNEKYNKDKKGIDFNINFYLQSCMFDYKKLSYNYFESDDYEEFEIANKYIVNSKTSTKLLQKKKEIYDKVDDLEKKLRLILNIPILFQIISIEFYNENKEYLCSVQGNRQFSFWNRLTYNIEPEEFANNSRFGMDYNFVKNTNNEHFNRALEFYNDSFESDKISNRFILIFSALEAIFNLDTEEITEKLSKYSAKLLAENVESEYNKIYTDIKQLYKKRCDYIHGSKNNNIFDKDEKLLRYYVRKIIISYWILILNTKMTAKQILKYLDGNEKLDIQTRLFISTINSKSFTEQQYKVIDLIEKELGISIPKETKELLLSNCNKEKKLDI